MDRRAAFLGFASGGRSAGREEAQVLLAGRLPYPQTDTQPDSTGGPGTLQAGLLPRA